jgi:hypothetical protein
MLRQAQAISSTTRRFSNQKETTMTANSYGETTGTSFSASHSETHANGSEQTLNLPDNFHALAAMRAAADAKMEEMQTTRAAAVRERWTEEAATLGLTPEQVLYGVTAKKPRGRKPKAKRDE